jgi:peptide chain release factor
VCEQPGPVEELDQSLVRVETFRSPGRGGQHVNTTDSGVRVTYLPTGDTAVSTDERSQHRNRATALARLAQRLARRAEAETAAAERAAWSNHDRIVRGDPVRVYRGMDFARQR